MAGHLHRKRHFTSFQIIIFGFSAVILMGSLLLMLPISSRTGQVTPFGDALFTSASADWWCGTRPPTGPCSARR